MESNLNARWNLAIWPFRVLQIFLGISHSMLPGKLGTVPSLVMIHMAVSPPGNFCQTIQLELKCFDHKITLSCDCVSEWV